jgi:hypothetical protein
MRNSTGATNRTSCGERSRADRRLWARRDCGPRVPERAAMGHDPEVPVGGTRVRGVGFCLQRITNGPATRQKAAAWAAHPSAPASRTGSRQRPRATSRKANPCGLCKCPASGTTPRARGVPLSEGLCCLPAASANGQLTASRRAYAGTSSKAAIRLAASSWRPGTLCEYVSSVTLMLACPSRS